MSVLKKLIIIILMIPPLSSYPQPFWHLTHEFGGGPKTGIALMDDTVLLVSTTTGIWMSTDDGNHFQQVLKASAVHSIHATSAGKITAGGRGMIYYSEDPANKWDSVTISTSYPVRQIIETSNGGLFAITGELNQGDGVFYSEDGGITWEQRNNGLGKLKGCERIAAAGDGSLYLAVSDENSTGNGGLFFSDDNGLLWKKLTVYMDSFYAPIKITNTTGLSVSPDDTLCLSFYGIAANFLVQLNMRKNRADVPSDKAWEPFQVHQSSSWWLDRPLNNIHFSKKGDCYSSYSETLNQGATYYCEGGEWLRIDQGLGSAEDGWRNEQHYVEKESGRIFMVQYLDERVYTTDKSLVTGVTPSVKNRTFHVFPNPVSPDESITISSPSLNGSTALALYGLNGRKIPIVQESVNTFKIRNTVSAGVYILTMKHRNGILTAKILVE